MMNENKKPKDFIKTTIVKFMNEQAEPLSNQDNVVMKELLVQALDDAFDTLKKLTPQTKKKTESVEIMDVKPVDFISFMEQNNIPSDAYFDGRDNGYDGYDAFLLSWDIDVPTTAKDKLDFNIRVFTSVAFKRVFALLLANDYKRVGFSSRLLKQFDDTSVYDMYIAKDYDRLVEYYTLSFIKE